MTLATYLAIRFVNGLMIYLGVALIAGGNAYWQCVLGGVLLLWGLDWRYRERQKAAS